MENGLVACNFGVMQRFSGVFDRSAKKKGAIMLSETMMYVVVIFIIFAVGYGFMSIRKSAKIGAATLELDQIRTAAVLYQSLRIDNQPPSDLGDLLLDEAISASESIDGMTHGTFLQEKAGWTTSGLKDPWGQNYGIRTTGGSNGEWQIYSEGPADGEEIVVNLTKVGQ